MEIGLSEVIKLCTRKMIKKRLHVSMQNDELVSGCGNKIFPIKRELWVEVSPRIIKRPVKTLRNFHN